MLSLDEASAPLACRTLRDCVDSDKRAAPALDLVGVDIMVRVAACACACAAPRMWPLCTERRSFRCECAICAPRRRRRAGASQTRGWGPARARWCFPVAVFMREGSQVWLWRRFWRPGS